MRAIPRPSRGGRHAARRLATIALAAVGTLCASAVPAGAAVHRAPAAEASDAAAAAGATTPFRIHEAEAGTTGGGATTVSPTAPPATQYSSAALEASGHAYVHLSGTGHSVQWTNTTGAPISFLNVRASIPDSASGGGDRYAEPVRQRGLPAGPQPQLPADLGLRGQQQLQHQ